MDLLIKDLLKIDNKYAVQRVIYSIINKGFENQIYNGDIKCTFYFNGNYHITINDTEYKDIFLEKQSDLMFYNIFINYLVMFSYRNTRIPKINIDSKTYNLKYESCFEERCVEVNCGYDFESFMLLINDHNDVIVPILDEYNENVFMKMRDAFYGNYEYNDELLFYSKYGLPKSIDLLVNYLSEYIIYKKHLLIYTLNHVGKLLEDLKTLIDRIDTSLPIHSELLITNHIPVEETCNIYNYIEHAMDNNFLNSLLPKKYFKEFEENLNDLKTFIVFSQSSTERGIHKKLYYLMSFMNDLKIAICHLYNYNINTIEFKEQALKLCEKYNID